MKALTPQHEKLLERHYDGDLGEFEAKQAEKLLASSDLARDFLATLKDLGDATRGAESHAWNQAAPPAVESVVECAVKAEPSQASLENLAPLLERFFDGETAEAEADFVADLIDNRADVTAYLDELEGLRTGVLESNEIMADVDFSGFWNGLTKKLDQVEAFVAEEHRVLLYRFNDGAATDDEIAKVHAWIDQDIPDVVNTLDALREIKFAASVCVETAQEDVDFSNIWTAVEDAIDQDLEAQGNIVAFDRVKREVETQPVLKRYRQSIYGAMAAIFLGVIVFGIFNEQLRAPQVIEKTIVIIDSVEYEPGASVMINSPFEPASAIQDPDSQVEPEPTVIWILDDGDETFDDGNEPAKDDSKDAKPNYGQPI